MQIMSRLARTSALACLGLAVAGLVLPSVVAWAAAGAAPDLDFVGGWRPLSLKGCALSVGTFVGALLGMPVNPMLGATVGSLAFHAALALCT